MNHWIIKCGALLSLASLLTLAPNGRAAEPDDARPFSTQFFMRDMLLFGGPLPPGSSATWGGAGAIKPTGDIDYVQVTCQGTTMRAVGISGFHLNGVTDIDIEAYDFGGTLLGSSRGTGPSEEISLVGLGQKAVYLKIFGFNGAVAPSYSVFANC